MKKIEASLIKNLLRISSVLELSHYSLSLTLGHIVFFEHFGIGSRKENKARERKEQARKRRIKQLQKYSLHVSIFMCVFL